MKIKTTTKIDRRLTKKDLTEFNVWLASKNMKAYQFAQKVGISHSYLILLFEGKRCLTDRMIRRFKNAGYIFRGQNIYGD